MSFVPIILDFEASGFGPDSYPIEVGIVMHDGRKFCRLIRPLDHWTHWEQEAEELHCIKRDVLEKHGTSAQLVARELNALLSGRTVYSDGWVVDHPWLNRLYDDLGIQKTFWLSSLEMVLSDEQMTRWHDCKQILQQKMVCSRHRASCDAEVIQQTWLATRKQIACSEYPQTVASGG